MASFPRSINTVYVPFYSLATDAVFCMSNKICTLLPEMQQMLYDKFFGVQLYLSGYIDKKVKSNLTHNTSYLYILR